MTFFEDVLQIKLLDGKLYSMIGLLLITLLSCYIPWIIKNNTKPSTNRITMSYLTCLAGGVVLGALLMHMIPESVIPHSHRKNPKPVVQWGLLASGFSFLVLLAIDRLFMHDHSHDHSHATPSSTKTMETSDCHQDENGDSCHHHHSDDHHHNHHTKIDLPCPLPQDEDCGTCHEEDVMGGCHMDSLNKQSTKSQALVFVVALSMHSFLEGFGIASKNDSTSLSSYMASMVFHKILEAFALGLNVLNANFSDSYTLGLILFYSILTPLGMVIGILMLLGTTSAHSVTSAVLNGLACGSFLFVSCIEMIPPEFHKKTKHSFPKFLLLSLGFVLISMVSVLFPHKC